MAARQWQGCEFKKSKRGKTATIGTSSFDEILRTVYQPVLFNSKVWDFFLDPRYEERDKAMRLRYRYMRRRDEVGA